jgi:alpha-glucosidase
MIVAPIIEQGATSREVVLPRGRWRHLWSGEIYEGGAHEIDAPIGRPPVYTHVGSAFAPLFESLAG